MKQLLIASTALAGTLLVAISETSSGAAFVAPQEPMCKVQVCNRIKRWSLDPFSHIKDHFGENCSESWLPKSQAVVDKELSSESRWYQGSSLNPTKRSVTYVKAVEGCQK